LQVFTKSWNWNSTALDRSNCIRAGLMIWLHSYNSIIT
jgi:hypothetical protein